MPSEFKIHPSIGIARLGDSPTDFYLCPDEAGVLPIECDADGHPVIGPDGKEKRVDKFKDSQNRVKRQGARFRVFTYDETSPSGRELTLGSEITYIDKTNGQTIVAVVQDVQWTVYLANKKSSWYEFLSTAGEHGYDPSHPLRNADITDPNLRQHLIIDPGPQTVGLSSGSASRAHFARGANPKVPQHFPPPLVPHSIDTLGELMVYEQDNSSRLVVLGGFGNSGSFKSGPGQPIIETYANNDGWFDDTSDGPVTAQLLVKWKTVDGNPPIAPKTTLVAVGDSAWLLVGYPRFAPQIIDIITMDDLVYDVAIRNFAYDTDIYGNGRTPPTTPDELKRWRTTSSWNVKFRPFFWRDIWPILTRPQYYSYVTDFGQMTGGDPHNSTPGANGNLDPTELCVAPHAGENPDDARRRAGHRAFVYSILRKGGQENDFTLPHPRNPSVPQIGMPYLCGDNPLSNIAPAKFLRLTDTQLFFLRQWAAGNFIDERAEKIVIPIPPGEAIDRGALATMLGGSFCPGAEACWILRNPAVFEKAFRVRVSPDYRPVASSRNFQAGTLSQTQDLARGLEPGDLTKYSGVPWQSDFNECSTQDIDITYRDWNVLNLDTIGDPAPVKIQTTYWWPSHRPMWVNGTYWSTGIPQTNEGDLLMVTAWKTLGFVAGTVSDGNSTFNIVEAQNL